MVNLNPDQRNSLYLVEAERLGIHKPILAALYAAQQQPALSDGETGLGLESISGVGAQQVEQFEHQVQVAVNTLRSLIDDLIAQGWAAGQFWDGNQGRYSDAFVQAIARGYRPTVQDRDAALLLPCNPDLLLQAYLADMQLDYSGSKLPPSFSYLDPALLTLVERISSFYRGLPAQREALVELVRIWCRLPSAAEVFASLGLSDQALASALDRELLQFAQRVVLNYSGYPYQREALLRMTQLWRQLNTREEAIASLQTDTLPHTNLEAIDPALIAFVERIPLYYQGSGIQRHALTEACRLWRQLESRSATLVALGIPQDIFALPQLDTATVARAAAHLDRELITFVRHIPNLYKETDIQRQALIRLIQLWQGIEDQTQGIESLVNEVKQMETARPNTPEAPPKPKPVPRSPRPKTWTPYNIQLFASIIPGGSFTWAEATHGGTEMPPNQATVNAIVRLAHQAQSARDRIGRPFVITRWYCPTTSNPPVDESPFSRHRVGDAIDFYVDGLTGDQLYWALDPWWQGGLGRYRQFPYLCHLDARTYRARWRR